MSEELLDALWMTFITAAIPVLEVRGAIPIGVAAGLPIPLVTVVAIIGNFLPVPFILLLIRRVFRWLRKFPRLNELVEQLERRAHLKGRKVQKYRTFGLVLLVAIPLPGTGAWTGALVADILDMRMRTALPAIFLGIVIAAMVVLTVTCGLIRLF